METTDQAPTGGFDFILSSATAERVEVPADERGTSARAQQEPGILGLGLGNGVPEAQPTRPLIDGVALVLAIVIAPLGLIVGVIAAVLGIRRQAYVSGLARAAIVISIVMSVILAGGGVAYSFVARAQAHEAALRSSSSALCATVAASPGRLADPAFGWPALTSTIPDYVRDVEAYAAWWTKLAAIAPAPVRAQVTALSKVATASSTRMSLSKVVEHDQDYADMQKAAAVSTLPTWVNTYCSAH